LISCLHAADVPQYTVYGIQSPAFLRSKVYEMYIDPDPSSDFQGWGQPAMCFSCFTL